MEKLIEEYYTYEYILTLIKSTHGLVQAARFLLKEYINTMTLKAGFKQWKTNTCLLYRANELGTEIFILYVYGTLAIRDKLALMDMLERIKK